MTNGAKEAQDQKKPSLKTIDDLRQADYNPRKISSKAAAALSKSLGDFGDLSGIVWNQRTGNLVCGHQRVAELRKLGAQLIDGALQIVSGERFAVRIVDWPIVKEKSANVVANSPSIAGEFTPSVDAVLDEIMAGIGQQDYSELLLDDARVGVDSKTGATELKEWDASELSLDGMFIFTAPIEVQAKVRAVLERELPGVTFREEVVYG
jgi:hypothetical protein